MFVAKRFRSLAKFSIYLLIAPFLLISTTQMASADVLSTTVTTTGLINPAGGTGNGAAYCATNSVVVGFRWSGGTSTSSPYSIYCRALNSDGTIPSTAHSTSNSTAVGVYVNTSAANVEWCPDGTVATGVRHRGWADFALICNTPPDLNSTVLYSATVTTPTDNSCATGSLMVGMGTYTGAWLDSLYGTCKAFARYAITYNINGGTGSAPPTFTQSNNAFEATLPDGTGFSRAGFTFTGWSTVTGGQASPLAPGTTYSPAAATTLYAQWGSTITYDSNNSTSGSTPSPTIRTYNSGNTTLATNSGTLAKTNFTFGGWNTATDGSGTSYSAGLTTYSVNGDKTLYAQWNSTITYNGNGNSSGTVPAATTATKTTAATTLATNSGTLAKTSYTFAGWSDTSTAGSGTIYAAGASNYQSSGNATLYAFWLSTPSTPSFVQSSDSGSSNTDNITNDSTPELSVSNLTLGATVTITAYNPSNLASGNCSFVVTSTTQSCSISTALGSNSYYFLSSQTAGGITTTNSTRSSPLVQVDTVLPIAQVTTNPTTNTTISWKNSQTGQVSSDSVGTVYLVRNSVSVSGVSSITSANSNLWKSVSIGTINTATNVALTGLLGGTYNAYAIDVAGNFGIASTKSMLVYSQASAPTNLVATPSVGSMGPKIDLSWTVPSDDGGGISTYQIEYSTDGGSTWSTYLRSANPGTTFSIYPVNYETDYLFRISAVNLWGTGTTSSNSNTANVSIPVCSPDVSPNGNTFVFPIGVCKWTVPTGVTSIKVDARGGQGGAGIYQYGVGGGQVIGTLTVTPGADLYFYVGDEGGAWGNSTDPYAGRGGFNGGGFGGNGYNGTNYGKFGGGGGGATDIRTAINDASTRLVVAGAAGGSNGQGNSCCGNIGTGGAGGGTTGGSVSTSDGGSGGGGTQSAGGYGNGGTNGGAGFGGTGQNYDATTYSYGGGGGGSGYYGGGGGCNHCGSGSSWFSGGGGGSSYVSNNKFSSTTNSQGVNCAPGFLAITIGSDVSQVPALQSTCNITKDITPPVISTQTASTDGSKITLTYTDVNNMSSAYIPGSAFTVTSGGTTISVSSISATGKTLTLTLAQNIKPGATTTISYADPSSANDSYAAQDIFGNDAATFSNRSIVTTGITVATPTTVTLATASDTGSSNSDKNTNDNTPTFTASSLVVGATVVFTATPTSGTAVTCTITASSTTDSCTFTTLLNSTYSITVKQTNGTVTSSTSTALTGVVISTAAPTVTITNNALTNNGTYTGTTATTFTITFSASVTGFTSSSIAKSGTNWTLGTLSGSGTTYTITATSNGSSGSEGVLTFKVNAGAGTDIYGNTSGASATFTNNWVATITYNANGGGVAPKVSDTQSSSAASITLPGVGSMAKTGNSFGGWSTTNSGTSVGNTYTPTANLTLYAVWAPAVYVVTYSANGGTGSATRTSDNYTYGSTALTLPTIGTLAKTGYTFLGWNTATNSTTALASTYTPTATITLYAVWQANNYNITFDKNNVSANGTMSALSITAGTASRLSINTFTRNGYSFQGWNTATDGSGTNYADGSSVTFYANSTLYAKWSILTPAAPAISSVTSGNGSATVNVGPGSVTCVSPFVLTSGNCVYRITTVGSSTVTIPVNVTNIQVLVVGGGGGGGWMGNAGGGGAGGLLYNSSYSVTPGSSISTTIGAGGAAGATSPGGYGGDSVFGSVTAKGGGGGAGGNPSAGLNGGSGGGGDATTSSCTQTAGGTATQSTFSGWAIYSNAGGPGCGNTSSLQGGGGGGAISAGYPLVGNTSPGKGGDGLALGISGTSVTYAAGGNGFGTSYSAVQPAGAANTGSGGGAGSAGGSGVIVLSYAPYAGTPTSYSVTAYDSNNISIGTCTVTAPATSCTVTGLTNGSAYTFKSTATDSAGTSAQSTSSSAVTPAGYVVTYNANNSTTNTTATYNAGTPLTLPLPTKSGYIFSGWYAEVGLSTLIGNEGAAYSPSSATTLYAKWSGISYSITYNGNGSTGGSVPSSGSYVNGGTSYSVVGNTNSLVKTGYTFSKWNTKPDGSGTDYVATNTYSTAADVTLYAKWTPDVYTITYSANGGTGAPSKSSDSYTYGAAGVTLPTINTLVKSGFTFMGWIKSGETSTVTSPYIPSGNITLNAFWVGNTYSISYNANGGSGSISASSYQAGTTGITLPDGAALSRTGYDFSGWATSANGSGSVSTPYTPSSDITLYAKWSAKTINVVYNKGVANSVVPTLTNFPSNTTTTYGAQFTVSSNIDTQTVTTGTFAFAGWSDSSTVFSGGSIYSVGTSTITLTAQWIQVFTVHYNLNGGVGTVPGDQLYSDGASFNLPAAPTRTGYDFLGWEDQAGAVLSASTSSNVSITRYILGAKWTPATITISYLPGTGGSGSVTATTGNYGTNATIATESGLTAPAQSVFDGWDVNGVRYGAGATINLISDATATAQWKNNYFSIFFDLNGGTSTSPSSLNGAAGTSVNLPSNPTRSGYVFDGWNSSGTVLATNSTAATIGSTNTTYLATWILAAPSSPSISAVSAGDGAASITVSPNVNGGAPSSYTVTASPGGAVCTVVSPATTCSISPLTNGTSYAFTAIATNSTGTSSPSGASSAVTPAGKPSVPTGIVATAGNTTAAISWNAPANSGGAEIQSYTITASPGSASCTTSTTSCNITGLTNGTAYTFTATANNGAGISNSSSASSAVTPATNPDSPTGVSASSSAASNASVSFTAPTNNGGATISNYTVTATPVGGGTSVTGSGSSSPVSVSGLVNGVAYTYTVTATNSVGTSSPSSASTSLTTTAPASAPSTVSAVAGTSSAAVTFSGAATNGATINSYTVTAYDSTGTSTNDTCTVTTSGTGGSCTVSGLSNGVAYTFKVTTNSTSNGSSTNSSPSLASSAVTPAAAPSAPIINTPQAGDNKVTLSWTPGNSNGATVTGYTVTAYDIDGNAITNAPTCTATVGTNNCDLTGLSVGVNYTFKVLANASPANSSPSSLSTPENMNSVPSTPSAPSVTTGNGSSTISIGSAPSENGYAITSYLVTASPGGATCTVTVPATSCTITGLTNGTQYTFTTSARNQLGNSLASTGTTGTPSTTPGAPTNVVAAAGEGAAEVSFSAPTNTGGASITSYTVTATPGGATATGSSSPITVSGLSNGTAYTLTVTASNANGSGSASIASSSVTPLANVHPDVAASNAPSGAAEVGQTLTAASTFSGNPTPTKTYQWQVCADASDLQNTCTDIAGATSANYSVSSADLGKFVRVITSASNGITPNAEDESPVTEVVIPAIDYPTPTGSTSATVGTSYALDASASGGESPLVYTVSAGNLPNGITLNGSSGVISGTPTTTGTFTFTISVTDNNGVVSNKQITITVSGGATSNVSNNQNTSPATPTRNNPSNNNVTPVSPTTPVTPTTPTVPTNSQTAAQQLAAAQLAATNAAAQAAAAAAQQAAAAKTAAAAQAAAQAAAAKASQIAAQAAKTISTNSVSAASTQKAVAAAQSAAQALAAQAVAQAQAAAQAAAATAAAQAAAKVAQQNLQVQITTLKVTKTVTASTTAAVANATVAAASAAASAAAQKAVVKTVTAAATAAQSNATAAAAQASTAAAQKAAADTAAQKAAADAVAQQQTAQKAANEKLAADKAASEAAAALLAIANEAAVHATALSKATTEAAAAAAQSALDLAKEAVNKAEAIAAEAAKTAEAKSAIAETASSAAQKAIENVNVKIEQAQSAAENAAIKAVQAEAAKAVVATVKKQVTEAAKAAADAAAKAAAASAAKAAATKAAAQQVAAKTTTNSSNSKANVTINNLKPGQRVKVTVKSK